MSLPEYFTRNPSSDLEAALVVALGQPLADDFDALQFESLLVDALRALDRCHALERVMDLERRAAYAEWLDSRGAASLALEAAVHRQRESAARVEHAKRELELSKRVAEATAAARAKLAEASQQRRDEQDERIASSWFRTEVMLPRPDQLDRPLPEVRSRLKRLENQVYVESSLVRAAAVEQAAAASLAAQRATAVASEGLRAALASLEEADAALRTIEADHQRRLAALQAPTLANFESRYRRHLSALELDLLAAANRLAYARHGLRVALGHETPVPTPSLEGMLSWARTRMHEFAARAQRSEEYTVELSSLVHGSLASLASEGRASLDVSEAMLGGPGTVLVRSVALSYTGGTGEGHLIEVTPPRWPTLQPPSFHLTMREIELKVARAESSSAPRNCSASGVWSFRTDAEPFVATSICLHFRVVRFR